MALPNEYQSYAMYFSDAVSFLKEHDFLFIHANTEVLSRGILKKMPNSWTRQISNLTDQDIIALPFSRDKCFGGFFEKLDRLMPTNIIGGVLDTTVGKISQHLTKGLSPKKRHEIFALCSEIHEQCLLKKVSHILDLGSGLGYLSQLLYEKHGYSVLGLEANTTYLKVALERQKNIHKTSVEYVKFHQIYVTEKSDKIIKDLVQSAFGYGTKFLIVGLHACGDLTINAIKLFLSLDDCEGICLMPCCYHRIYLNLAEHVNSIPETDEANDSKINSAIYCDRSSIESKVYENDKIAFANTDLPSRNTNPSCKDGLNASLGQRFYNFPLSDCLKHCFCQFEAESFLQRPFLRLGCQKPQTSLQNGTASHYQARVFHLLSRAVLQLYAFKEGAKLTKAKRRGVRRIESSKLDFSSFLEDAVVRGYVLQKDCTEKCINDASENINVRLNVKSEQSNCDTEIQFDRSKILALWNELSKEDFKLALLFTVMQDSLQGLCENVILLDKLAYLSQHGGLVEDFRYVKVTDERISPRCFALVANKITIKTDTKD